MGFSKSSASNELFQCSRHFYGLKNYVWKKIKTQIIHRIKDVDFQRNARTYWILCKELIGETERMRKSRHEEEFYVFERQKMTKNLIVSGSHFSIYSSNIEERASFYLSGCSGLEFIAYFVWKIPFEENSDFSEWIWLHC